MGGVHVVKRGVRLVVPFFYKNVNRDVFLRFSPCSGWVGGGRLGGSVAGKYCSGGGFGLGGLVRKGREQYRRGEKSTEGERRVQKECV